MGVDLTLLVVDGNCGHWGYAHTMLPIGRNYDTHDAIKRQHPSEREDFVLRSYCGVCPDGSGKGDPHYGKTTETAYGEPITYLSARKLVAAMAGQDLTMRERAALAYLRELDESTLVALYWH